MNTTRVTVDRARKLAEEYLERVESNRKHRWNEFVKKRITAREYWRSWFPWLRSLTAADFQVNDLSLTEWLAVHAGAPEFAHEVLRLAKHSGDGYVELDDATLRIIS